jgi:hypothetical protein
MTKRIFLLAAMLLCLTSFGFGQANEFRRFEIASNVISILRLTGDYYGGGDLSFAFHKSPRLAFVADVAVYEVAIPFDGDQELTIYGFGPRYSLSRGKRWMFFGQALAGGARVTDKYKTISPPFTTTTSVSANGFSMTAGGGVDLGLKNWIALRLVDVDYTFLHFSDAVDTNLNGIKVGIGVVFRFGKK